MRNIEGFSGSVFATNDDRAGTRLLSRHASLSGRVLTTTTVRVTMDRTIFFGLFI
jgi:hypothetical protein